MIRKLEEKDRQLYIEMAREFYHSDAVLHPVPDSHFEKTSAEALSGGGCAEIFILEYDSAPAGYALTARSFRRKQEDSLSGLKKFTFGNRTVPKALEESFLTI